MARPMYPHELGDADFSWLISTFLEQHPNYIQLDSTCLPVVLLECVPGVATGVHNSATVTNSNDEDTEAVVGEE